MLFVCIYSLYFNKKTKITIQIHYTTILVCINKNLNEKLCDYSIKYCNIFFVPIPAFRCSPRFKSFFSMLQQELPLVALLLLEKIAFKTSGLPLQSGAVAVIIYISFKEYVKNVY